MNEAVIVSAVRTPIGKAPNGALRRTRPDDMGAVVIKEALRRTPGLDPAEVEDVILGCAMPEAEQGLNVARIASLRAGVPVSASAVTVNRFCSSGLQSIASAAERIMTGFATTIVAGGTESMSLVPMGGNKIAPNPGLVETYPTFISARLVAENLRRGCRSRESRIPLRDAAISVRRATRAACLRRSSLCGSAHRRRPRRDRAGGAREASSRFSRSRDRYGLNRRRRGRGFRHLRDAADRARTLSRAARRSSHSPGRVAP